MKNRIITTLLILLFFVNITGFAETISLPYEYEKHYEGLSDMAVSENGTLVGVGENGVIYTCVGDKWNKINYPLFENLTDVEYGNGLFYAISAVNVYSSHDGIDWERTNKISHKEGGMFYFNGKEFVIELIEKTVDDNGMERGKNLGVFLTSDFVEFEKVLDSPNDNKFKHISFYEKFDMFQEQKKYIDTNTALNLLLGNEINNGRADKRMVMTFQEATGVQFPVKAEDIKYLGKCTNGYEVFYILDYNLIHATTNDFVTWNENIINLPDKSEHLYSVHILYNNGYYIKYHTNKRYEYSYTTNFVYSQDLKEFDFLVNAGAENGNMYIFNGDLYTINNIGIYKLDNNVLTLYLQIDSQKDRATIKYSNGKYVKWEYNKGTYVFVSDDGQEWEPIDSPDSSLTYTCNVEGEAFYDMIWDGKNYIIRATNCDNGYNPTGEIGRLFIYDASLNLINELHFDNYILDMSYENGKYNVLTNIDGLLHSSTDLINWATQETDMTLQLTNNKTSIVKKLIKAESGYSISDYQTKIKIKDAFKNIVYENYMEGDIVVSSGRYIKINGNVISLSDDGAYWQTIQLPSGVKNPRSVYVENNILYVVNSDVTLKYNITNLYNEVHTYVEVEGKILGFDVEPIIEYDRTLVPLRFIFETLGADVDWEVATRTAVVKNDEATILFSIDNTTAKINSMNKEMDVPARLVNGKTMVPLRFLSEELGFNVEWDEETRTATISK